LDASFLCPYCGEPGSLEIDPGDEPGDQVYVEDCGVCCRPWSVRVHTDAEGEVEVTVDRA
jgi:hypothetical protein